MSIYIFSYILLQAAGLNCVIKPIVTTMYTYTLSPHSTNRVFKYINILTIILNTTVASWIALACILDYNIYI